MKSTPLTFLLCAVIICMSFLIHDMRRQITDLKAAGQFTDEDLQRAFYSGQIYAAGWRQCEESYGITNGTVHEIFAIHYHK